MQTQLYSKQLDTILAGIAKDPERPFSTELYFEATLRRDRARRFRRQYTSSRSEPIRYLRLRQLQTAVERSRLTRTQLEVFSARLAGHNFPEIAARHGHSIQAAHQLFQIAVAKVRRAWKGSPFVDLATVYVAEMSRARPISPEAE